jgi:ribosomal protein S18 acetylase RimI-like enzyme
MQFEMRERSYAMQFPAAEHSVILFGDERAGSMIVDKTGKNITLADIAVLPQFRKSGIATNLVGQIQDEAAASHNEVVLHVDKANIAALRVYAALGFEVSAETDLYYKMTWTPK